MGLDEQAGLHIERRPYADGEAGIQDSLATISRKVREGYDTMVMKSFAGNVLKQAGMPRSTRARAYALGEFVRANVTFAPDARGREQIQSAHVTLCVDGAPICIPIGDCDDGTCAVSTLCEAAGIRTRLTRQIWRGAQQHVLPEAQDDDGGWIPLDWSADIPMGQKLRADDETYVDPLHAGGASTQPMLIGVGAPRQVGLGGIPGLHYKPGFTMTPAASVGLGASRARVGLGALCDQDSVLSYKRRLLPAWSSLRPDVEDCPNITLDQKTAFRVDYAAFNSWYTSEMPRLPFCGDTQILREGQDLEAKLNSWRNIITRLGCLPTGPELPPLRDDDPRSPNYKPPESETIATLKTIGKTVAIVGGVAATVYGVYIAAPLVAEVIRTGLSHARKKSA